MDDSRDCALRDLRKTPRFGAWPVCGEGILLYLPNVVLSKLGFFLGCPYVGGVLAAFVC